MPLWLDYLCAATGLISFALSLLTYWNTRKLKLVVLYTKERADYKNEYQSLEAQIDGFILSLSHDLQASDLSDSIDIFVNNLTERYSFLKKSRVQNHVLYLKMLYKFNKNNNHLYITRLNSLKIQLNKEAHYDSTQHY